MPWAGLIAVAGGAVLGAWARWGLSAVLNPVLPSLPLGTLAANLAGGFLIGITLALGESVGIPPVVRLGVTTGFLGALTTFSAFSAEAFSLIARGQYGWAALLVGAHTAGSVLLTGAGFVLTRTLLRAS
ncbi:MAG: fluoride efflux transporter CrcB [Pseudomonadota bacterium]|jgi:crcB protein|nr:MAG: fluoride efflux transporter CrcB [Pseudomonadota bacterium]